MQSVSHDHDVRKVFFFSLMQTKSKRSESLNLHPPLNSLANSHESVISV